MPGTPLVGKPRACANCSRAKAKCIWSSTEDDQSDSCQRCSRINLTCSRIHSASKKRRGKASHAKVIEQKLDDIMTLLRRDREPFSQKPRAADQLPWNGAANTPITMADSGSPMQPPDSPLPSSSGFIRVLSNFHVSFAEASRAFQRYMSDMLPQFPFIPLPSLDAYEMYRTKPLLMRTLLWVCVPPNPVEHHAFEVWFRQHVAHQIVVVMNKSLELVEAIMVFLVWKDIYFYAAAKDTSLVQLAVGLVEDLRLNTPPKAVTTSFESIVEDAAQLRNDVPLPSRQSLQEHRAILGVYYLTSTLSGLVGRRSRLEYTSHLDDCCQQLRKGREYPEDLLLVHLISLRRISNRVNDAFGEATGSTADRASTSVQSIAVNSLLNDLDAGMKGLPEELKSNPLLLTHCAAVRVRLFESFSQRCKGTQVGCRAKWDCLESTRALYDAFRLVPVEAYPSLTFITILHLALAIIKALRMNCVEEDGWDLNTARIMLNIPEMLQHLSEAFESASSLDNPRCRIQIQGKPMLSEYAEAYSGIERWYLNSLNLGAAESNPALTESVATSIEGHFDGFDLGDQLWDLTQGFMP